MPLTGGIYTVPFFVNKETTGPVVGDFDTVLFIVNVTSGLQSLLLTVHNLDGSILATIPLIGGLAPNQTRVIRLSEVLT